MYTMVSGLEIKRINCVCEEEDNFLPGIEKPVRPGNPQFMGGERMVTEEAFPRTSIDGSS